MKFSIGSPPVEGFAILDTGMNSKSKFRFGKVAVISGEGVVSTPILSKLDPTIYFLNLEGVTIGDKRFANKQARPGEDVALKNINIFTKIDNITCLGMLHERDDGLNILLEQCIKKIQVLVINVTLVASSNSVEGARTNVYNVFVASPHYKVEEHIVLSQCARAVYLDSLLGAIKLLESFARA
ncbi:hypothetical protein RJ639_029646 [Escallonia herrerae]|uniref:Uncharacterized protein n=1 Tax=Escallonia herrerae TaxID=1293975 RepID=A0AA89BNL9_9ASTE|nr:hypothetical protein RJ639_029646 [Escallonia herrerae]